MFFRMHASGTYTSKSRSLSDRIAVCARVCMHIYTIYLACSILCNTYTTRTHTLTIIIIFNKISVALWVIRFFLLWLYHLFAFACFNFLFVYFLCLFSFCHLHTLIIVKWCIRFSIWFESIIITTDTSRATKFMLSQNWWLL